jgi:hypothetical protein
MLVNIAFGTFVVLASVNPSNPLPPQLSYAKKVAAFNQAQATLNGCIAEFVRGQLPGIINISSPQFVQSITDSFSKCSGEAIEFVLAWEEIYGVGTGRKFFTGPYLDTLPGVIAQELKKSTGPLGAAE